ncbi:MAG: hypothetical protein ACO4CF_14415 [bacterium]
MSTTRVSQSIHFLILGVGFSTRSLQNRCPHREMGTKLLQSNAEMGRRAFSGNTVWEYSVLWQALRGNDTGRWRFL